MRRLAREWPRYALNAAFVWYLVMLAFHFENLSLAAMLQAFGLAGVVGTLLTGNALGGGALGRARIVRFYLIPFCVSSFTASAGPAGFVVVFSPSLLENAVAALLVAAYLLACSRFARKGANAADRPTP